MPGTGVGFSPCDGACAAIFKASSLRMPIAAAFWVLRFLGGFAIFGCDVSISSILRKAGLYAQNVVCRHNQAKVRQDWESASSVPFATVKVVRLTEERRCKNASLERAIWKCRRLDWAAWE